MTARVEPAGDPRRILTSLATLRALAAAYPAGHPVIADKLREVDQLIGQHLQDRDAIQLDIVHGVLHLNNVPFEDDHDLRGIGVDSVHIRKGVQPAELLALAEVLSQLTTTQNPAEPVNVMLARQQVRHVSVGRLVPLDTSWRGHQWADRPAGALDPDYEESLALAQQTFEELSSGRALDTVTVQDLVRLLISRVATSHAALAQILAVKQYENLTYCHSVNVSVLSLLIGRQVGLDDETLRALVEAALLHDVGKTRIPLDLVKKPGALDKHERKVIEGHTTLGAELLAQTDGLGPLTPLVALEHHRSVTGGGYPDLGAGVVPHAFSQIVSVADIYEAITGARSYQAPTPPERACLVLARLAGEKLNGSLVKAFVGAITFFPIGSLVRTSRDEIGLVIRTAAGDPLHPVISLVDETRQLPAGDIDTSERDVSGAYCRHIVETLPRSDSLNLAHFLPAAA
jgi:putative nucleotidyltransferase with HDIG domain